MGAVVIARDYEDKTKISYVYLKEDKVRQIT